MGRAIDGRVEIKCGVLLNYWPWFVVWGVVQTRQFSFLCHFHFLAPASTALPCVYKVNLRLLNRSGSGLRHGTSSIIPTRAGL